MPFVSPSVWIDAVGPALQCYAEHLLRNVAQRLIRPRNQWPVDELIQRIVATTTDVPLVDRRLKELDVPGRQVMALLCHSRQPLWNLGNLVELAMSLGHDDGLRVILDLLEAGMLFPHIQQQKIGTFEHWLSFATPSNLVVFAHPLAMARGLSEPLPIPAPEAFTLIAGSPQESDGLDWILKLAILWQQVAAAPLRRTQQGEFFKRDLERLENPLLQGTVEGIVSVPDPGFLTVALAELLGIVAEVEGELHARTLPAVWNDGIVDALEEIFTQLFRLSTWNCLDGWKHGEVTSNPFPSAYLLALMQLGQLPAAAWAKPEDVQDWLQLQHPYWKSEDMRPSRLKPWTNAFLQGLCAALRLVQTAKTADGVPVVRLSALGRWMLGLGEKPSIDPVFPKTLLIQPNLEILAYRQGLTPILIVKLTQLANWKTLGAAGTLQLEPDSVYRALEAGQSFDSIQRLLDNHGTRPTPPTVLDSLRTWSNKRERLTIYPAATLLEFNTAEDMTEALARGLPAVRLSERLAVVASENDINYSHFRLTSTRDYGLPPERCVEIENDGVTLSVDVSRSDLLLETELSRFAELQESSANNGRRKYQLTPASIAGARAAGLHVQSLEQWFQQRTGHTLPPAALLLLTGEQAAALRIQRELVLHFPSAVIADGVMQWPQTNCLIESRLGPTAVSVQEENVAVLRQRLAEVGIGVPELGG